MSSIDASVPAHGSLSRWPVAAAALFAAAASAQIKVSTQTVAALRHRHRQRPKRLVPDLRREDFEVYDNGKPQQITNFDNPATPISAVVMLDTSGSMTLALDLVKQAAEEFLLSMLPEDKAKVGAFNDKLEVKPEAGLPFSNNRDQLIRALEDLDFGYPDAPVRRRRLQHHELEAIDGRKVVLVFTDGEDTASRKKSGDVIDRARAERGDGLFDRAGERVLQRQAARAHVTRSRAATPVRTRRAAASSC